VLRARDAERREIPNDAESRTARNPEERKLPGGERAETSTPSFRLAVFAVWEFALSGIPRL
jgi:hypothetical protein